MNDKVEQATIHQPDSVKILKQNNTHISAN